MTRVGLERRKEMMRRCQIWIERKRLPERGFRQVEIHERVDAKFFQEPAAAAKPCPSRREGRILRNTEPEQFARAQHGVNGGNAAELLCPDERHISGLLDAGHTLHRQLKSVA